MKKSLSICLSIIMILLCVIPASAVEATDTYLDSDSIATYLENYNFTFVNSSGNTVRVAVALDEMSSDKVDELIAYVATYGVQAFEDTIESQVSLESESQNYTLNIQPRVSTSLVMTLSEGNTRVTNEEYTTAEFDNNYSVEYIEVLGLTITVTNGVISGVSNPSFSADSMSPGGSISNISISTFYNNTAATISVDYTVTKTIGTTIPLKYSTDKFASLVVLKRS